MGSRLPGFAAVALCLLALSATAAGAGEERAVTQLKQFLADVQTLRADFRQQVVDSKQEIVEESSGTVVMQRPGRFRWDYREPFERVIVSDGNKVWLYEADLAQVTIRQLSAGIGDTPAALLTGRESVLERFNVSRTWREKGIDWVLLKPRSADSDFSAVTLGFSGPVLARLRLDDRLGQQTRIDFTAVQSNPSLEAQSFEFRIPPGADVIDDSDL